MGDSEFLYVLKNMMLFCFILFFVIILYFVIGGGLFLIGETVDSTDNIESICKTQQVMEFNACMLEVTR